MTHFNKWRKFPIPHLTKQFLPHPMCCHFSTNSSPSQSPHHNQLVEIFRSEQTLYPSIDLVMHKLQQHNGAMTHQMNPQESTTRRELRKSMQKVRNYLRRQQHQVKSISRKSHRTLVKQYIREHPDASPRQICHKLQPQIKGLSPVQLRALVDFARYKMMKVPVGKELRRHIEVTTEEFLGMGMHQNHHSKTALYNQLEEQTKLPRSQIRLLVNNYLQTKQTVPLTMEHKELIHEVVQQEQEALQHGQIQQQKPVQHDHDSSQLSASTASGSIPARTRSIPPSSYHTQLVNLLHQKLPISKRQISSYLCKYFATKSSPVSKQQREFIYNHVIESKQYDAVRLCNELERQQEMEMPPRLHLYTLVVNAIRKAKRLIVTNQHRKLSRDLLRGISTHTDPLPQLVKLLEERCVDLPRDVVEKLAQTTVGKQNKTKICARHRLIVQAIVEEYNGNVPAEEYEKIMRETGLDRGQVGYLVARQSKGVKQQ